MINYLNTTLSSFQVTMNVSASLTAIITPSSLVVHQSTTYSFSVIFTQVHINGDILVITFPASISPPVSPICAATSGISSASCTANSTSVLLTMSFTSFPANYTIIFTITNIKNYDIATTVSFSFLSMTSTLYSM
jgi:hypothetical protein